MGLKVILTGATGMVGEGVLLELLQNAKVESVLVVGRRACGLRHAKLKEILFNDFAEIPAECPDLVGWDSCFYCAGLSSVGMSEDAYTKLTFDMTLRFADIVHRLNPSLVFNFVSGQSTDGSGEGKVMWARVKGKTENALRAMFPEKQFSFRPGAMKPFPEQKHIYGYNIWVRRLWPVLNLVLGGITLSELGRAMIVTATEGAAKSVLEAKEIRELARSA